MCGLRYSVNLSNVWWDDDKEMHLLPRTWELTAKAWRLTPWIQIMMAMVKLHLSVDSTDIVNIDMDDKYSL